MLSVCAKHTCSRKKVKNRLVKIFFIAGIWMKIKDNEVSRKTSIQYFQQQDTNAIDKRYNEYAFGGIISMCIYINCK